jgi:hypothetical protein
MEKDLKRPEAAADTPLMRKKCKPNQGGAENEITHVQYP